MAAAALPHALEDKLDELAQQVRWLRLLRGLSRLALVLFVAAGAAILADYAFDLSRGGRGLLLLAWVGGAGLVLWRMVLRPLRRPVPIADLAAAVEEKYPSLAERLYTVVDLSGHADAGNGSAALIDVLVKETSQRVRRLNFFRAAPTGSVFRLAVLTVLVAILALAPVLFVTGATERVRRFLLPWYTPRVVVSYTVTASSGDVVAKRGEAVTLTGFLTRTDANAVLPESAAVVFRESGTDAEKKLPMTGDDKAAFQVTRPGVGGDFAYCVEAGPARSPWFAVTVVDPVELADGTSFTITPPAYAAPTFVEAKHPGLHEFEGLQYSRVRFDLTFNRPAAEAALEWKPGDPNGAFPAERVPVILSADRKSGRADFTLKADGTLKLVAVGDHKVRTEIVVAAKAVPDAPPKFVKVTGVTEKPQDIRPDDSLPIEIAAEDDVKIASVVLEYRLNDDEFPVFRVPLPLKDVGTPRADGKYAFSPAGKAKEGDVLRFRVRAADGRSLAEYNLSPQEVVFPEKGWASLKLDASAKPLAEQEILAQKQKLNEKLREIAKEVEEAVKEADAVLKAAEGKAALGIDQAVRLENARARAKEAARALDDLARETALTPDLRPAAAAMRDVAENHLRKAESSFRKAAADADSAARDAALKAAADALAAAGRMLQDLLDKNDEIARNRLDQKTLERLAAEEAKLAAELKAKANDPEAVKEIAAKQKKIRDELQELVKGNDAIRRAIDAITTAEARDLSAATKRLADDQAALDRAAKTSAAAARKDAADAAAAKQKAIAGKAAELAKKTQTAAKLADADPADPAGFDAAGEKLAKDDALGAMTEQEKAARELDRLAAALERGVAARKDPKEAVRQLAKLEDDLRKRVQEATKEKPFDQLPAELQKQLRNEQEAVRRTAEKLAPPPADELAKKAAKDAVDQLAKARDALAGDGKQADDAMTDAADALRRLGDRLPSREQRLKKTRDEIEQLQREQNQLSRDIAEQLKAAGKPPADAAGQKQLGEKLAKAAAKQAEIADKLAKLDTPGLDGRKARAAAAAGRAAEDAKQGLAQDIPASQQTAKKELDRLKDAADNKPPADELADELAKKQKQLADAADKLDGKPTPGQLQEMQELQREIAKQLETVKDPDAAARLNRAKEAAAAAEKALKNPDDVDELKKKTKQAAAELDRLADELAGAESDREQVERLAREREDRAEAAKQNAGKPTTPEETAAEQRELEREIEALEKVRAGGAQAAKKKVAEQLEKLRQQPTPERAPATQKAAAEAMKDLADQMKANGDRDEKQPRGTPRPGDDDADGGLPNAGAAAEARKLAKEQREARDELAKAAEQAGKGAKPTDNAGIEKLAGEQGKLAEEAAKAGEGGGEAMKQAAGAAGKAAAEMKAGNPADAAKAGKEAAEKLDKAAKDGGNTPAGEKARDLAGRQQKLNGEAEKAAADAGAAAAQQKARQGELAEKAGKLADDFEKAAKAAGADAKKVDAGELKKAGGAAKEAQKQMQQADRDAAAGRVPGAAAAREKANDAMDRAAGHARAATGEKPGEGKPDPNARAAGKALQDADAGMQKAGKDATQPGKAAGAAGAMQKAADDLAEAADKLAKGDGGGKGDGKGEGDAPGAGTGGGTNPGGNDGSAGGAPTGGDLPKDLQPYLGKPWGELPGDIQSKIIQDLKAKYGDDYARVIKLYFEQIAERK